MIAIASKHVPLCSLYFLQHPPPSRYFKFRLPHNPSTEVFIPCHCIAPLGTKGGAIERVAELIGSRTKGDMRVIAGHIAL